MYAKFFHFTKEKNSTARPTDFTSMPVHLRENCSILSPVLIIKMDGNTAPYWEYAQIPEFSDRYYFITDWEYVPPFWHCYLKSDPMATWRDTIGNYYQYILRADTTYTDAGDEGIIDTAYMAKTNPFISQVPPSGGNPFSPVIKDGCYVIGLLNNDTGSIGAVGYYVLTESQFRGFCADLMGNPAWAYGNISEISEDLLKSLFNPFQYVTSCMWFPFKIPGSISSLRKGVPVGWWDNVGSFQCHDLELSYDIKSADFSVPAHPQSATRGSWLSSSQYSKYVIDWPAIGTIELDPLKVGKIAGTTTKLSVQIYTDLITGQATISIIDTAGFIYGSTTAQIGVPMEIAQMNSHPLSLVTEGLNAIKSGGMLRFSDALSGIGDALSAAGADAQTNGSNGNISAYAQAPLLLCTFYSITSEGSRFLGIPVCAEYMPKEISAWMTCKNPRLGAMAGSFQEERDTVLQAMTEGFVYE